MRRRMRILSSAGDTIVAEWSETTTDERLKEIEAEFNAKMQSGFFAVDITDKKDEQIRKFDPAADILLIPAMQGG